MTERQKLLESIASTAVDYRAGELAAPTPAHVDRWISQFDAAVQLPLLRELDHILRRTYFSKEFVAKFFARQIKHEKLAGANPCDYWRTANLLDIQQDGGSQADIRALFGEALTAQCGIKAEECGADGGAFVYLDDVMFSGGRIGTDLEAWLAGEAPASATVNILVIASHRLGEWQRMDRLKKAAPAAGKNVAFHCWAAVRFENRKRYRDASEVLWPATLPDDAALQEYMAQEERFPFELRRPGGKLEHNVFSSEEGRQLLERELLLAGMRIRAFCKNPSRTLRPLGFSAFGLGFGSMIVTFRNCPNNCPLALWWGDPDAGPNHPFSKWYPLFQRKTYVAEVDFDVIDF